STLTQAEFEAKYGTITSRAISSQIAILVPNSENPQQYASVGTLAKSSVNPLFGALGVMMLRMVDPITISAKAIDDARVRRSSKNAPVVGRAT
ncbi:hypothetical protein, partial [Streptococcus pneumoniae]|uniref:hypothetical protein n=1 Tax=Streptococcus pneumoniae TaxID=1313 RepID=UPI001E283FE7